MILYVIRHAQSANNALWAATGTNDGRNADPPLTDLGHLQAQHLARYLAAPVEEVYSHADRHDRGGFSLTHLYTSLMIRSIATAGYVAAATGLPLRAWTEIHERGGLHQMEPDTGADVGVAGPNRAWFAAEYPHLILPDAVGDAGWWNRDRETEEEFLPRARVVWRQLLERHGDTNDRVAVVSHGGFFQSLLWALLSADALPPPAHMGVRALWFGVSNTAISRFEFHDGIAAIRYLNRVDHLPTELITG